LRLSFVLIKRYQATSEAAFTAMTQSLSVGADHDEDKRAVDAAAVKAADAWTTSHEVLLEKVVCLLAVGRNCVCQKTSIFLNAFSH